MENIINIDAFISQLSSYFKICVLANKGTPNDAMLEQTIKQCNKIQKITAAQNITNEDELFIRRTLKRFNLSLKVDHLNNPVDIKDKQNQNRLMQLQEHESLKDDDLESMLAYLTTHNICIFPNISLAFFLVGNKFSDLLWDHTRLLFYMTQFLLSKNHGGNVDKEQVYTTASRFIEDILTKIATKEEECNINQLLTLDNFLKSKIIDTKISSGSVSDASKEVKEIFAKKGISEDNSMFKMIDMIGAKLGDTDLSGGNIMQTMFGIAQNVAEEFRGELGDGASIQDVLGTITEIFDETMSNGGDSQVPDEFKGMMGSLMNLRKNETENDGSVAPAGEIDPELIKAFLEKK